MSTVTTEGDATFLPGTGWVQPKLDTELEQQQREDQAELNRKGFAAARAALKQAREKRQ